MTMTISTDYLKEQKIEPLEKNDSVSTPSALCAEESSEFKSFFKAPPEKEEAKEPCFFDLLNELEREDFKAAKDVSATEEEDLQEEDPLSPSFRREEPLQPLFPLFYSGMMIPAHITQSISTYLHPQVTELFEHMIETLTVMDHNGISQTSITLNAESFRASVFYGAEIIIKEYSTAPKSFNIELIAGPQAVALAKQQSAELAAALQNRDYNFTIHRLDLILSDTLIADRKERDFEDNQEQEHDDKR